MKGGCDLSQYDINIGGVIPVGLMDKGIDKAIEKLTPVFEERFAQLNNVLMQILAELQKMNAKLDGRPKVD